MIPFKQIPSWKEDSKVEISTEEFTNLMSAYEQFSYTIQEIYNRQIEKGILKMKYFDDFNNELSEDVVRDMINQYNNIEEEKTPN